MLAERVDAWFSHGTRDFMVSVAKQSVFVREGGEEIKGTVQRRTFAPGDIDRVREYIGTQQPGGVAALSDETAEHPVISTLNAIWTLEVIAERREKQKELAASKKQRGAELEKMTESG